MFNDAVYLLTDTGFYCLEGIGAVRLAHQPAQCWVFGHETNPRGIPEKWCLKIYNEELDQSLSIWECEDGKLAESVTRMLVKQLAEARTTHVALPAVIDVQEFINSASKESPPQVNSERQRVIDLTVPGAEEGSSDTVCGNVDSVLAIPPDDNSDLPRGWSGGTINQISTLAQRVLARARAEAGPPEAAEPPDQD